MYTRISVDLDALHAALCGARWEAPGGDELARDVALALATHLGAKAIELGLGDSTAILVRTEASSVVERVPVAAPPEARLLARPRSGWGRSRRDRTGAELGATRCFVAPLPARHTSAYVVVWLGRSKHSSAALGEALECLTPSLGLLVDAHALLHRVARLSRHAHSDNRRLRRDLRQSLGLDEPTQSPAMRRCLDRAQAVAPYDTPVLVTGPSGAGKELVARRIHALSARADGPFVQVNCGAIPEGLVESELFGHERGAFTGAVSMHRGLFERAAAGTLLLDEVAELSPASQVKLLRVLQEGTFSRVGAESPLRSDARVIAATHRDLGSLVEKGAFREDLFYRLAVFEVQVPGLHERLEDLPRLVRQLVDRIAVRMGRPAPAIPAAVLDRLVAHDWPGNVRQLENLLEAALVMSPGVELELPHLARRTGSIATPRHTVEPLEDAIRRCIESALASTGGKLYGPGGAALRLGLEPSTLQSKMRKLGIDRRRFID